MRFEDEHYVKLYTRDTPTWRAMPWEARALLPLLMRVMDKAGLMDCGELDRVAAVSAMVNVPAEVVGPGLAGLQKFGVIQWHAAGTLEMPKFEEGQEARKSDILRKREERQRARDKARAQTIKTVHVVSHEVTKCHTESLSNPTPSPTPSPSSAAKSAPQVEAGQPDMFGGVRAPEQLTKGARKERRGRARLEMEEPSPPGWHELTAQLYAVFRQHRGSDPSPEDRQWKSLKQLRARVKADDPEIIRRWGIGLQSEFKQRVDTFAELSAKWDSLTGTDPPPRAGNARKFVNAQDVDKSSFAQTGTINDF